MDYCVIHDIAIWEWSSEASKTFIKLRQEGLGPNQFMTMVTRGGINRNLETAFWLATILDSYLLFQHTIIKHEKPQHASDQGMETCS